MELLTPLIACAVAYVCGSLSFAVIVSRWMKLDDPRTYGSGNPGATNVLRSGNKKAALLTLLFDAFKGLIPVAITVHLGAYMGLGTVSAALVVLGAFLGHLYPVFYQFKGGKGVATAAGLLLGIHPLLGLMAMGTWLLVAISTRYSSLAALVTALAVPFLYVYGTGPFGSWGSFWQVSGLMVSTLMLVSLLLIWRHRSNIAKLLAGTESKIGRG